MSPKQQIVVKFGVPLVLASAGLMGFLHQWEDGGKTRNVVYPDTLAGGLPTACNGITKHVSPVPVVVGEYWSDEKCAEVSKLITERGQIRLLDCVRTRISQNTFDALSSHAHNFGNGATCASRALELINRGHLEAGCEALAHAPDGRPVWSYVDKGGQKVFVRGLYRRRLAERDLCKRL